MKFKEFIIMERYRENDIKRIGKEIIGKKVIGLYYERDGNYFVMEFKNTTKTSVKFIVDLLRK